MMTKIHYELFAEALRMARPEKDRREWIRMLNSIATTCERDNPRFDRTRFLIACGYGTK